MTRRYVVNGEVVPADEAVVNVRDRGFLYGDGAFETMRVYGGSVFAWDAHLDRLDRTCEILSMDHGIERDQLHEWVHLALEANEVSEAAVRLSITRGVQPGKLTPATTVDPTVVVIVRPLERGGTQGTSTWSDPAQVRMVEVAKIPDEALPARAKTHNYLNGILARLELEEGDDEALLCDLEGNLMEGTTSNVFVVDDGTIFTPSTAGPVLPGITRETVIDLAETLEISLEETTLTPKALFTADEAFLTNSTKEIWPIGTVDGQEIGGGPITEDLQTSFNERIESQHYNG